MLIVKQSDPPFKKRLEIALEMGKCIMIEALPEKVAVQVESLIKKKIGHFGDTKMIEYCRRQLKYDSNFYLVMTTNLAKPHFDVNITN